MIHIHVYRIYSILGPGHIRVVLVHINHILSDNIFFPVLELYQEYHYVRLSKKKTIVIIRMLKHNINVNLSARLTFWPGPSFNYCHIPKIVSTHPFLRFLDYVKYLYNNPFCSKSLTMYIQTPRFSLMISSKGPVLKSNHVVPKRTTVSLQM